MMNKPIEALAAKLPADQDDRSRVLPALADLKANSSNNTLFADDKGEIAYLHPQFVPRRDDRFDYTKPLDGSDPRTDWHGLHTLSELPNVLNPPNGWVQNTNNWPYRRGGAEQRRRRRSSRATWTRPARTTAVLHAQRARPAAAAGRSRGCRRRPTISYSAGICSADTGADPGL